MWFIGVEVEQETSAAPPKKILDPPLLKRLKFVQINRWLIQYLAETVWKSRDFSGHVTIENEVIGYSAFR